MGLMGLISIISSLRANLDLERIESRNHRVYAPIYRGARAYLGTSVTLILNG